MPIYEYVCNACNEAFALLQKVGSEKDSICPRCGSNNVRKRISAFSCSSSGEGFSSFSSSGFSGGG